MGALSALPTGTVTFLFTDIEDSARLWEEHTAAMRLAWNHHDALLREAIETGGGVVFKTVGAAFCAVFATASEALSATLAAQRALAAQTWEGEVALRVRMALHTGSAHCRDNDYFGPALNRVARLLSLAHGGQVLLSEATQELARLSLPPEAGLQDMGYHRLKDLQQAEHVFQLCHPDLPADFPPLKSLNFLQTNLPVQTASFIGREQESAAIRSLLAKARLLTLVGSGGVGKSRLMLQVAADLVEDYADGVWLVELAPLADPALVPQAVAAVLKVHEEAGRPLLETLTETLRSKQMLLLLDNCEHLLDAAAHLSSALLQRCPRLQIVASSREGLGIAGEQTYRVPSLSLPPLKEATESADLAEALRYESVRLFADRAASVKPDVTFSDAQAATLVRLCHRLDGIPLAIELAAARIKALPLEPLAARLDDRFRLLTGGSRTALPRHQTLRALIDWSYDLLSAEEQQLLGRLSVFVSGWSLEAAEAVCAGDGLADWQILDGLTSLVDKSLVTYAEESGQARYRLLETVRQYARDRLYESGSGAIYRDRHADWFLRLTEQAETQLQSKEQAQWLERLEREHDNVRAALEWSLSDPNRAETGLRLAGAIWRFWEMRGYLTEGRSHLAAALARTTAQEPTLMRAKALTGAGNLAWRQGDYTAARALHEESLAVQQALGNDRGVAAALSNLGLVAYEQGAYTDARHLFTQSLATLTALEDRRGMAAVLGNLGMVADRHGDYDEARRLYGESLAIKRALGDSHGVAGSLENLGLLADQQGAYEEARALLEEGLALRRELGDRWGVAATLSNLSIVAKRQGDHAAAQSLSAESLTLFREMGDNRGVAVSLLNLGTLAYGQGDLRQAQSAFEESL
ncbi:MAG TPA: tetratricopeptide repeat protein, partial [Chthonomonadaceae bacterium]|nr:tetratricopeptide repeat protein [Chthonomonadaceae bacterium]